ncbi:hypothetical protein BURKHO8Y_210243 [Burkholderia sp. 8Y]|nr:hypothetical protein BURKHO8Y_210243 [Burkholderia sp. 8Y]
MIDRPTEFDGLARITEYHYNGLWAVDCVLYPDGSTCLTQFDESGGVSGDTDELSRSTRMVNDARGSRSTTGMTLHMCSTSRPNGCGNTITSAQHGPRWRDAEAAAHGRSIVSASVSR